MEAGLQSESKLVINGQMVKQSSVTWILILKISTFSPTGIRYGWQLYSDAEDGEMVHRHCPCTGQKFLPVTYQLSDFQGLWISEGEKRTFPTHFYM